MSSFFRGTRFATRIDATFSALHIRNYRLFFIGQVISNTGNWLTNIALVLLVLKLTGSGSAVGWLAACQYGPLLLITPAAGAMVDRHDKRKLLVVTQIIEMMQSFALAAMAFLPGARMTELYVLAVIGGVALAFDNPLRRAFVSEMVPSELLPNAIALNSMVFNTSRIIGPTLAGFLVVTAGYGWAFLIDAISYIAALAALVMMRPDDLYRKARSSRYGGTMREGIRYIASMPVLWIPLVMLMVIGTLAYNFTVTFPLFVTKSLGGSEQDYTFIYSIFSFGAIVCALAIASQAFMTLHHIIRGALLLGVTLLIFSLMPGVWAAIPAAFLIGVASILYTTSTTTNFQMEADQAMHGRVLALQSAIMIGSSAIGGPLLGSLSDAFGARLLIVIGAVSCFAAAIWGRLTARRTIPSPAPVRPTPNPTP